MCDSSFRQAMSEPPTATSSGAAQAGEEGFVAGDDPSDGRRLGRRIPLVELERAAEDDPVGPREHVPGPAGEGVLHLRLRLEDRELTAGGTKILVVEQAAAAEARAVEHQTFRQRGNLGGVRE